MTFPIWAVPGRKVVCVKGGDINPHLGLPIFTEWPVEKQIYSIRKTGFWWLDGSPVLMLYELRNPDAGGKGDHGWCITRFRPLVTLEEDMLTFMSLINTVPVTTNSKETT